MVHCRFVVLSVFRQQGWKRVEGWDEKGNFLSHDERCEVQQVKLTAVKGEPFGSATPNGEITMTLVNPNAFQFAPGEEFDVVFTRREPPTPKESA